jgi:hypothetical protein
VTLALVLAATVLAGCGGGGHPAPAAQTITGDGFAFQAPPGWVQGRTATAAWAASGRVDRVEVLRFTLERSYRPALFAASARELDRDAALLAKEVHGEVRSRTKVAAAGEAAWSYKIASPPDRTEQITFVLDGGSEYELFCRRLATQPNSTCAELRTSFSLGSSSG